MYRHQGMAVVTVSCEAPGDFDGTATRCCNGTLLIGEGNAPLATGGHDWENQFVDRVWTYWPHWGAEILQANSALIEIEPDSMPSTVRPSSIAGRTLMDDPSTIVHPPEDLPLSEDVRIVGRPGQGTM